MTNYIARTLQQRLIRSCNVSRRSSAVVQVVLICAASAYLFWPFNAAAQSDAESFALGRVAFDKYKDCGAAEKAFTAVSVDGQNNPLWLSYMARTEECLDNLAKAIHYYEKYNQFVPGQVETINKLADLRYRLSKIQERQDALNRAAELRRQREEAEAQQRATFRADALRTLDSDSGRLVALVNDYQRGDYLKSLKASAPTSCQLETETKFADYGHEFHTLEFASVVHVSLIGQDIVIQCQGESNCVSVEDKSHALFEHHIPNNTPRNNAQFSFATKEEAQEAAKLMKRIAAACGKP